MTSSIIVDAVKAGIPLIEIAVVLLPDVDPGAFCTELNADFPGIDACPDSRYGVCIQVHPAYACEFGIVAERVWVDEAVRGCRMWRCSGLDRMRSMFKDRVKSVSNPQPGGCDDGQEYEGLG